MDDQVYSGFETTQYAAQENSEYSITFEFSEQGTWSWFYGTAAPVRQFRNLLRRSLINFFDGLFDSQLNGASTSL